MSLFRRMLVEEWRMHSELFGSGRFGAFPVAIALLTGGATWLLAATGTTPETVAVGLHALALFFGLQVGTIGLIGRDAMRDVLGDITPLIFTARTLPLSWRRLLATFLVKDVCYYSAFMVTPVVVGFGAVALALGTAPSTVALAWVTVTGVFALGITLSLSLTGIGTRSRLAVIVVAVAVAAALLTDRVDPVAFTPYALFDAPSMASAVRGFAAVPVLAVVGVLLFRPADGQDDGMDARRHHVERLLVRATPDALGRRPMLAVSRSSGSVWKVLFSMGVLLGVTALALDRVALATGIQIHAGLAFGTLLGLGSFTTYSWVTMFDDPREHLRYPVTTDAVFRGTRRAFVVLSVAAAFAYLALAALWYPIEELAVGAVLIPPVTAYVYGVTAYVAGFSPNELLFDTPLFVAFGVALAAVALPLLVAALAVSLAPTAIVVGSVVYAGIAGGFGLWLTRRAGPRWHARLRA